MELNEFVLNITKWAEDYNYFNRSTEMQCKLTLLSYTTKFIIAREGVNHREISEAIAAISAFVVVAAHHKEGYELSREHLVGWDFAINGSEYEALFSNILNGAYLSVLKILKGYCIKEDYIFEVCLQQGWEKIQSLE